MSVFCKNSGQVFAICEESHNAVVVSKDDCKSLTQK